MSEVRRVVDVYEVRMRCDKCLKGFMEPDSGSVELCSYPPQYLHVCNRCGHTKIYDKKYPYVEYRPKKK